jgi:succinate dehydrogenase/fumarate reductase cytochrome b subunit
MDENGAFIDVEFVDLALQMVIFHFANGIRIMSHDFPWNGKMNRILMK